MLAAAIVASAAVVVAAAAANDDDKNDNPETTIVAEASVTETSHTLHLLFIGACTERQYYAALRVFGESRVVWHIIRS